jgi:hypothetical protein
MTQTEKYWIALGLLFMAFGYTADGYQAAAYVFSVFAVYASIEAHGFRTVYRKRKKIAVFGLMAALLTILTGLSEAMPAVWFVSFCSVASSLLFEESSVRSLRSTVAWLRLVMAVLYLLAVLLPYSVYGLKNTMLLITAAFMPMQLTYFHKVILIDLKKNRLRMTTHPEMY